MRADKNWEDSVGKRLFDIEGDLSPQAWENISKRIAPKPKRRPLWYWLPVVLLFIALPVAFYKGGILQKKTTGVAKIPAQRESENRIAAESTAEIAGMQHGKTGTEIPPITPNQNTLPNEIINAEKDELSPADPDGKIPANTKSRPSKTGVTILAGIKDKNKNEPSENPEVPVTTKVKILAGITGQDQNKTPETAAKKKAEKPVLNGIAFAGTSKKKITKNGTVQVEKTNAKTVSATETGNAKTIAASSATTVKNQDFNLKNGVDAGGAEGVKPTAKLTETTAKIVPSAGSIDTTENTKNAANTAAKTQNAIAAKTTLNQLSQDSTLKPALPKLAAVAQADSTKTSQKPEQPKAQKCSAWGIYATPQYTFQRVSANVNDDIMILRMTNKNDLESERVGYEFGLKRYIQVKEKVQLEVGLQFARVNHYIKFVTASTIADSVTVTQQGGKITMEIRNREHNEVLLFKYFFGGLYTGANVCIGNGWKLSGGVGANWLLWKNPDEEKVPIPTHNLNPYVSAGLSYQMPLNQNLVLQAGPTVQYFLSPVQKETAHYRARPTTVGFTVGLLLRSEK